ncbi:MAG: hypothetical protein AAF580_01370 [Pseudomonadota bacterium]
MDSFLGGGRQRVRSAHRKTLTAGNVIALSSFAGAVGLLAAAVIFVWQYAPSFPDRERSAAASRVVPDGNPEAPVAPLPLEPEKPVREVREAGVAVPQLSEPLRRAPSTMTLPAPPPPAPERYRLVVIEGANLINVRSHAISLGSITAPSADTVCTTQSGETWPCGRRARAALRRLVRRRAIDCMPLEEELPQDRPLLASCSVAGIDLAGWLVEHGWASPVEDAPETLLALHREAREQALGLFSPTPY